MVMTDASTPGAADPYGGARARTSDASDLLRLAPGAVYQCVRGTDGRIIWERMEGALAEEMGVTTSEVAGRPAEDIFPPEALRPLLAGLAEAFAGRESEFTHDAGGRTFQHVARLVPHGDPRMPAVRGRILDITDIHRVGEESRVFAAALSHDIRAPLTAARNYTAILRRHHAVGRDDEARKHLARLDDALNGMSGLMEDLLRLSEATRLDLEIADVELGEIAAQAAGVLREREPSRTARLWVDDFASASGDERLLRILMEHLLVNAWKAARALPGASVEFGARDGAATKTFVLRVKGAGIGPRDAARLFRSETAFQDPAEVGSLSISLAIIDCIVRRHGGRMWTEPVEGGSSFCFTLNP